MSEIQEIHFWRQKFGQNIFKPIN